MSFRLSEFCCSSQCICIDRRRLRFDTNIYHYQQQQQQPLRKHAYSNILKILLSKNKKKIQIKKIGILYISVQNIDCRYSLEPPRRGGSNEYPRSMF